MGLDDLQRSRNNTLWFGSVSMRSLSIACLLPQRTDPENMGENDVEGIANLSAGIACRWSDLRNDADVGRPLFGIDNNRRRCDGYSSCDVYVSLRHMYAAHVLLGYSVRARASARLCWRVLHPADTDL